jgi:xylan 1,4-beta-xylosidase
MARSRELTGPYELHPDVYILSSRRRPDLELQRAGHADLVETQHGETYLVHLCGRPLPNRGRCTLGRETAIQRMMWSPDGWLRTIDGQGLPYSQIVAPALPVHEFPAVPTHEDFDSPQLPLDFQWLRSPWPDELFSLSARSGHLRLYGQETVGSAFRQALVARRQQAHCYSAATVIDFEPESFQQMAGLICYYNGSKFHYLYISHDETWGKHLRVMSCLPDQVQSDSFTAPISIPGNLPVHLRVEVDNERLYFGYRLEGSEWQWLPEPFDASVLSDEAAQPGTPNFTGAFVGICCQDSAGTNRHADFDYFDYQERTFLPDTPPQPLDRTAFTKSLL